MLAVAAQQTPRSPLLPSAKRSLAVAVHSCAGASASRRQVWESTRVPRTLPLRYSSAHARGEGLAACRVSTKLTPHPFRHATRIGAAHERRREIAAESPLPQGARGFEPYGETVRRAQPALTLGP
jgi:hypothetical protein